MKITQIAVDSTVIFFRENLIKRYKFLNYESIEEPTLFFGIHHQVEKINNHKGYKVVYLASPKDGEKVRNLAPSEKLFIKEDKVLHGQNLVDIPNHYQKKHIIFETKPYDNYVPNMLGNKVYVYLGSEGRKNGEFQYERIKQVEERCNFEFIYGMSRPNNTFYPEDYVKENWYDKCFVNINLSKYNGLQSMVELAFMGRKTIANFHRDFPCVIKYNNDEHIIEIIESESKKIGTIQPSINVHNVKDEWLNIEWWKNE
jgi:hypothetical protein